MAISSLGIGSGLDLNGILTSLMQVEQQPLLMMQKKEVSYQARISALGSLKGYLSSLQTASATLAPAVGQTATAKYQSLRAATGDSSIATATASAGATATSYSLTNIKLAAAQQIRKSGTALGIPASGSDGTLSIKVGTGSAVNVTVKAGSTLSDIATAINQGGTDVTAAVINDGSTDHLVVSAKNSGAANTISISGSAGWEGFNYSPDTDPLDGVDTTNAWTQQQAAASASVNINGLTVTSNSNTISSAISGVTITLMQESVSGTSLSVTQDNTTNITSSLNTFIKAYNAAANAMKDLGAYNPETKVAGALQGDSALRGAQTQVRGMIQTTAGGDSKYQMLSDIGVAVQADGTLKLDSTKLNAAIDKDFAGVATLVAKIGSTFKDGIDSIVGASGSLTTATDNTTKMVKDLQSREKALQLQIDATQARYTKQFSSLDTLLSKMNSTSSWLTQQLASLPGASSK